MNDTNDTNLADFLTAETKRVQRSTNRTWILGLAGSLFAIGYMTFIYVMARTFFDPLGAAYLVSDQIKTQAPIFLQEAEVALIMKAPDFADQVSQTFIKAVPELRALGQQQIDAAITEIIPQISLEFQSYIKAYFAANGDELKAFVQAHSSKEFADEFTRSILADFATELDQHLKDHYGNRDLVYFKDNTLLTLQSMDQHLSELLAKKPSELDRREQLQRQILAALTHRLINDFSLDKTE